MKRFWIVLIILLAAVSVNAQPLGSGGIYGGGSGGGGSVATDTIFTAAGDLVQGTGASTAAKLTKGAAGTILRAGASLNAYSTSTFADTYVIGGLLHAATANTIAALAPGAVGSFLMSNGNAAALSYLAAGAANQILVGAGVTTAPVWINTSANVITMLGSANNAAILSNIGALSSASISDTAYDATTWDAVTTIAPSKNAIRDLIESRIPTGADGTNGITTTNTTNSTSNIEGQCWSNLTADFWTCYNNSIISYYAKCAAPITLTTGGTTARTITIPDAAITVARTDAGQTFTGVNIFTSPELIGEYYDSITVTNQGTGNILLDGTTAADYNYNNGASAATYTPIFSTLPASGKVRYITFAFGGGAGVITKTWTNVTWIGTAGSAVTITNKYDHYACILRYSTGAFCSIVAEASTN